MKAKSSSWNQIIPYCVAAIAITYLIYVLVVQGNSLQYIHFWIFLLIVVLVLAPLAGRLKIWNLIDFNAKFESLRKENKKELDQIRSQITSIVQTSIVPMQHQWTVLGVDEQVAKKLAESITEQFKLMPLPNYIEDINGVDSARIKFLRKADIYRYRAYDILSVARTFQIAIREGRMPELEDMGSGEIDDRIDYLLNHLLDGGAELFVPPTELAKTTEELKIIDRLLKLYNSVDGKQADVPSEQESSQLFDNIQSGIAGIRAGIMWYGSQAIVAQSNLMLLLKKWKKELVDSSDSPDNKA